ncbi:MAG: hypothetical protein JWN32_2359 [Solirubrobacterales bacterium]|nr:hypothetical protein [Solirubrobacterales bacterium]
MVKRIRILLAGLVAFAALGAGGTALAASHHHAKHAKVHHAKITHAKAHAKASGTAEQPGTESESGTETETAPGSDGPGGHADEPGNPNADHQFDGVE